LTNQPGAAQCNDATVLTCRATAIGTLAYLNYTPDARNNFSIRPEFFDDQLGQRTGTKARYFEFTIGWQHWLSPQLEMRPEIGWYTFVGGKAFNGDTENHNLIGPWTPSSISEPERRVYMESMWTRSPCHLAPICSRAPELTSSICASMCGPCARRSRPIRGSLSCC
jgi:hypothetical protein